MKAAPLKKIPADILSSTIAAMSDAGATRAHADWVLRPGNAEKLITHMDELMRPPRIITVPDLSPIELVARAECDIKTTHLSDEFAVWDFYQHRVPIDQPERSIQTRGKRYEVLTYAPGKIQTTDQVRRYFKGLNADGNTGAFISWVMESLPRGVHVSIPYDDTLLWRRQESGTLYALYFDHEDDRRGLDLRMVNRDWHEGWTFVAFREIP